jgi:hypothetical protein
MYNHMKLLSSLLMGFGLLFMVACNSDAPSGTQNASGADNPAAIEPFDIQSPSSQAPPAVAADGKVYHYACPNACGGGDAAGTCPVCGAAYAHNQAWHDQNPAQNPTQNQPPVEINMSNPAASVPTAPATPAVEPAQNAAGVWHYICSAGCSGGAGAAGSCGKCGAALSHNQAYHN